MQFVPTDWLSMLILTFVLGMKHGFDADHLATIDGLTRSIGLACGSRVAVHPGA